MTWLLLGVALLAQEGAASVQTFRLDPGTGITIEIGAGDVRITGSTGADVQVRANRATAALEAGRLLIRSADAGGPPDRDRRSEVQLLVPAFVEVESVKILDGTLTLKGLHGRVSADVRQGRIRASDISGLVRLETGFGDVDVESARLVEGGLLRLRAFNGDVRLALAGRPAHARILALTFNGQIDSMLPLSRRDAFGPKFAEATLGNGEPVVSLDSVTGNISITVADAPRQ